MKKISILKIAFVALVGVFTFSSCESLDQYPEDYFTNDNFWRNSDQVRDYYTGLYIYMRNAYASNFFMGELRGGLLGDGNAGTGTSVFGEAMSNQSYIKQDLREDNAYFSNWNAMYQYIIRINLAIQKLNDISTISDNEKAYYLGVAYGLRAYYYFFLYRTWGEVPYVTDVAILDGRVNAERLSRPRAAASQIMGLIKSDVNESLAQFDRYTGNSFTNQYTWSRWASLMLKADVYNWAAKVTTGDQVATGTADLQTAKDALQEIINSGRFSLKTEFYQAFRPDYKDNNSEIIFAVSYNRVDRVYSPSSNASFHLAQRSYFPTAYDLSGNSLTLTDQSAYGINTYVDGFLRYQYKESFWRSFDATDTRRDVTFFPVIANNAVAATGSNFGTITHKFAGSYESSSGVHYFDCDGPIYRYAEVLLLMAEVENELGNDPSLYINQIRARAYYGSTYTAYTNSTKYENTKAILTEFDKEFVLEGKRWFLLRRMTDDSGNHLVFDASVNYPFIVGTTQTPLLSTGEAHKQLWPLSTSTLTNDPALRQTVGYETRFNR